MKITLEEAARILDEKTVKEALRTYGSETERLEACEEACHLACGAMREKIDSQRLLTPGELTEMAGKPVWVRRKLPTLSGWNIISVIPNVDGDVEFADGLRLTLARYCETWWAYRRELERRAGTGSD